MFLSDRELSFHLISIGIKRNKLKSFMDLDIAPDEHVFRAVAMSAIVSQQSLSHDDAPITF